MAKTPVIFETAETESENRIPLVMSNVVKRVHMEHWFEVLDPRRKNRSLESYFVLRSDILTKVAS